MKDMFAISSSDVRKDWSSIMDLAIREKPVFIKRTRDYMMLATIDTISELVSDLKFVVNIYHENDGSVTLYLNELDIVVNSNDISSAKSNLVKDIIEYAEEYYKDFARYSNSPNRRSHLPYVIKALTAKSPKELENALTCPNGEI